MIENQESIPSSQKLLLLHLDKAEVNFLGILTHASTSFLVHHAQNGDRGDSPAYLQHCE